MASAFIRSDLMGPYPAGVPNPQTWHAHPYPTRFHGGVWTRPVFGFPVAVQKQSVLLPGRDIRGLGNADSSSESGLWDEGRGIFRPGGYGGGVFDGNLAGLGGNEATYPWGTYSENTKKLQEATNTVLKSYGYCPISTDGKLGPATCGARAQLVIDTLKRGDTTTLYQIPDACPADKSQMTAPRLASSGCGSKTSSPIVSTTPGTAPTETFSAGMSSSSKKALAFVVAGVGTAIGLYLLKKNKGGAAAR